MDFAFDSLAHPKSPLECGHECRVVNYNSNHIEHDVEHKARSSPGIAMGLAEGPTSGITLKLLTQGTS